MKEKPIIKVGFCVSYDWELLAKSIPRIYDSADIICLAIDKNRKSWFGNPYEIDNDKFYSFVKEIDRDKKIDLYEDDFTLPDKKEYRHRMMLADRMGSGGWHIQVDADEYFLDFDGFAKYLLKINPDPSPLQKPVNVCCPFIPLIKKTATGYLHVNFERQLPEIIPMATNKPDYKLARQNGHFNITSPYYVIHETWARSEEELWFKINNWGHASEELAADEKKLSYFNFWKSLDENNYFYVRDYHPAKPEVWPAIGFVPGNNVEEFIDNLRTPEFPLSRFDLLLRNSRNVARLKSLFS